MPTQSVALIATRYVHLGLVRRRAKSGPGARCRTAADLCDKELGRSAAWLPNDQQPGGIFRDDGSCRHILFFRWRIRFARPYVLSTLPPSLTERENRQRCVPVNQSRAG